MNRRAIVVLVAVLALLGLGVAWLALSVRTDDKRPVESDTATATNAAAHGDVPLATPDAAGSDRAPTHATLPSQTSASAAESAAIDPELANATWIDGRVEFAAGTPLDERISVVAVGHKFEHRPLYEVSVESDGRFRVAFANGTRTGWLRMNARYSYLATSDAIGMAEPPKEVVLQPRLGGCVRGKILLDANGAAHTLDVLAGSIRASGRAEDFSDVRAIQGRISSDLTFEIGGLVSGLPHTLHLAARRFVATSLEDVTVERGVVATHDMELHLGTRIAGHVVDASGTPIAGAKLQADGGQRRNHSFGNEPPSAKSLANGSFEIVGLPGGQIELFAQKQTFAPTSMDLGELALGTNRDGLDVVLTLGECVAGKVQWPDGTPAYHALVEVRETETPEGFDRWRIEPREPAATDGDGGFRITGLQGAAFVVIAKAWVDPDAVDTKPIAPQVDTPKPVGTTPDAPKSSRTKSSFISRRGTPWSARAEGVPANSNAIALTLAKGASIRGHVLDQDGKALERFTVTTNPIKRAVEGEPSAEDLSSLSRNFRNKDGSFVLDGLQSSDWNVVVKSRNALESPPQRITVPGSNDALEFRLLRGSSISGIVSDPVGEPIAGARVVVQGVSITGTDVAKSHAKGVFVFGDAPIGPIRISAEADGFAKSQPLALEIVPSQTIQGLTLVLRRGATLTGEVIGFDGKPAAGSRIDARISGEEGAHAKADEKGAFKLEHLAPGTWSVTAEIANPKREQGSDLVRRAPEEYFAEQDLMPRAVVELADGGSAHVVLTAKKDSVARLSGKIVASRPVEGWINALRVGAPAHQSRRFVQSKPDGTYSIALDAPGEYLLVLQTGDNGVQLTDRVVIAAGENTHDFVLPNGRIAGRVVDAEGKPATSVSLRLSGGPHDLASAWAGPRATDTSEEGTFAFDALPAGVYAIDARAGEMSFLGGPASGCAQRAGIELAEGASVEGIELKLTTGATVSGSVHAASGGLMPNVSVCAFDASGTPLGRTDAFTTDNAGRYTITDLPNGRVLLFACTPHSAGKASTTARAGTPVEVDIVLAPAAEITAAARDASGASIAAAFELSDDEGRRFDQISGPSSSADDGSSANPYAHTFHGLPAGKYVLRALADSVALPARDVHVAAGEHTDVVLQKAR